MNEILSRVGKSCILGVVLWEILMLILWWNFAFLNTGKTHAWAKSLGYYNLGDLLDNSGFGILLLVSLPAAILIVWIALESQAHRSHVHIHRS